MREIQTAEKDLCRKAIADYKKIRPVVQLGDIYRLISPYDHLGAFKPASGITGGHI